MEIKEIRKSGFITIEHGYFKFHVSVFEHGMNVDYYKTPDGDEIDGLLKELGNFLINNSFYGKIYPSTSTIIEEEKECKLLT